MSRLIWDQNGERLYETGVKNGVLYVMNNGAYGTGVPWNGLTAVTESPSGAEATALYADDIKYLNLYSAEEFGATIEAYTYPPEFAECDGSASLASGVSIGQQARKTFGMCYKTTYSPFDKRAVEIFLEYCKNEGSNRIQKIKKVHFSGPCTIVLWDDNTKTIVRAQNEVFDPEKGLAMAIAKKFLGGNKGRYFDEFKKWCKPCEEQLVQGV